MNKFNLYQVEKPKDKFEELQNILRQTNNISTHIVKNSNEFMVAICESRLSKETNIALIFHLDYSPSKADLEVLNTLVNTAEHINLCYLISSHSLSLAKMILDYTEIRRN